MAVATQIGMGGQSYSSIVSSAMYPEELRKNGVDEATRISYITKDIAKFTYLIHKNKPFSKKLDVNDRMFKTRELTELSRFYTIKVASTDTYHKKFGVINAEGSEIKVNNVLYHRNLYVQCHTKPLVFAQAEDDGSLTGGTLYGPHANSAGGYPWKLEFSRVIGTKNTLYMKDMEQMLVTAVGAPDSAGAGYTEITVDRCFFAADANDLGGKTVNRAIVYSNVGIAGTDNGGTGDGTPVVEFRVDDILLRGTPAYAEGTGAPTGVYKNPTLDENYTQEYKYAYEKTKESDIVSNGGLWINESAFDISRWLVMRQMSRDREYSNLIGRKAKQIVDNKELYITGGVWEFIKTIHKWNGAAFQWPGWLDMGKNIFGAGGSDSRICFCSITMDAELRKMFWNEHLFLNEKASDAFNMEVNTMYVSGGKLHFIPTQILEEAKLQKQIICLDLAKQDAFEPVTNKGYDYKVDDNDGKGIQEPGVQLFKEQVIGMFGLRRRYQPYHCILDLGTAF